MKLLKYIEAKSLSNKIIANFPPDSKFIIIKRKNNRGDYGFDEHFWLDDKEIFIISYDGARVDVKFYLDSEIYKKFYEKS